MLLCGVFNSALSATSASMGITAAAAPFNGHLTATNSTTEVPELFDPVQLPHAVEANLLETTLVRLCRMEPGETSIVRLSAVDKDYDHLIAGVRKALRIDTAKEISFEGTILAGCAALLEYYSDQLIDATERGHQEAIDYAGAKISWLGFFMGAAATPDDADAVARTLIFSSQPWEAPEPLQTVTFRL